MLLSLIFDTVIYMTKTHCTGFDYRPTAAEIDGIDAPIAEQVEALLERLAPGHRTAEAQDEIMACGRAAYRLADPAESRRLARLAERIRRSV